MKNLFNTTFFNELMRFSAILGLALFIIIAVNYYQITFNDIRQQATAMLFGMPAQ